MALSTDSLVSTSVALSIGDNRYIASLAALSGMSAGDSLESGTTGPSVLSTSHSHQLFKNVGPDRSKSSKPKLGKKSVLSVLQREKPKTDQPTPRIERLLLPQLGGRQAASNISTNMGRIALHSKASASASALVAASSPSVRSAANRPPRVDKEVEVAKSPNTPSVIVRDKKSGSPRLEKLDGSCWRSLSDDSLGKRAEISDSPGYEKCPARISPARISPPKNLPQVPKPRPDYCSDFRRRYKKRRQYDQRLDCDARICCALLIFTLVLLTLFILGFIAGFSITSNVYRLQKAESEASITQEPDSDFFE